MFKFVSFWGLIALFVFFAASCAARPQFQRQLVSKRADIENRDQDSEDLEGGAEKDDLKGSASYGYGYYGYPFGGYGGLYSGGLYGGGIYPYSYSLHSGYYGGYYPHYGGYGGLGYLGGHYL